LTVSWRWIVDTRGDQTKVDWPRLGVVVAAGLAFVRVASWLLPDAWFYAVLVVVVVVGLVIDVRLRRTGGGRS